MFWQYQQLSDSLYSVALLSWVVVLVLLHAVPGLLGILWASYKYKRSEAVGVYIARFVPYWLFTGLIDMSRSLLLTLIAVAWALRVGLIAPELSWLEGLRIVAYGLGGVWLFNFLRRVGYRYWAYLIMPYEAGLRLKQDFVSISLLATLLLTPLSLLSLIPQSGDVAVALSIGVICLSLMARTVMTLFRLLPVSDGYVCVFLYLCTHEWLPWCLIALVGQYWVAG